MEHAYLKGVKAHRDIKPANIMIDQNKNVKISDFDLAGVLPQSSILEQGNGPRESGCDENMQTVVGSSIGTPEYMSPEQFTDFSACDERSDIYSFGIMLYRMASGGKLPFFTDNPTYRWTALKHFHQETPVPKLKSPLYPIIQRCLEKVPWMRYPAFKELRADLETLLKQETGEIVKLPSQDALNVFELSAKGLSLNNIGRYDEAIACYDKALKIDPSFSIIWSNKGLTLNNLRKYDEAIACCDKALNKAPQCAYSWTNKGLSLQNLGHYVEAIQCFKDLVKFSVEII